MVGGPGPSIQCRAVGLYLPDAFLGSFAKTIGNVTRPATQQPPCGLRPVRYQTSLCRISARLSPRVPKAVSPPQQKKCRASSMTDTDPRRCSYVVSGGWGQALGAALVLPSQRGFNTSFVVQLLLR